MANFGRFRVFLVLPRVRGRPAPVRSLSGTHSRLTANTWPAGADHGMVHGIYWKTCSFFSQIGNLGFAGSVGCMKY